MPKAKTIMWLGEPILEMSKEARRSSTWFFCVQLRRMFSFPGTTSDSICRLYFFIFEGNWKQIVIFYNHFFFSLYEWPIASQTNLGIIFWVLKSVLSVCFMISHNYLFKKLVEFNIHLSIVDFSCMQDSHLRMWRYFWCW